MMKIFTIVLALALAGCASQPTASTPEPEPEKLDIDVFYEQPEIEYQELGRVDMTSRAKAPIDVLDQVLRRAIELGADGVIVHSSRIMGTVAGPSDRYGTGGGRRHAIYQIKATAITYDLEE